MSKGSRIGTDIDVAESFEPSSIGGEKWDDKGLAWDAQHLFCYSLQNHYFEATEYVLLNNPSKRHLKLEHKYLKKLLKAPYRILRVMVQ